MAIQNISESVGFSPVEQVQSAIPVVPAQAGSSPASSTGEGAFAPKVSSPVPGEVLPIKASNLQPQVIESALGSAGDTLSGALSQVEGVEGAAAKNAPLDPQGAPAVGKLDAPARVVPTPDILPPAGLISMPAPPTPAGATPKPAPTYKSVLSTGLTIQPDTSVTIQAEPVPVSTPKGEYSSVLPKMAGVVPQDVPAVSGPRTITGAVDAYRRQDAVAAPAAQMTEVVQRFQQNPNAYQITKQDISDQSPTVGANWAFGDMTSPNALVIHHTAGRGDAAGVIQTFKDRGFPAHFVIDREGEIVQVLGDMQKGKHAGSAVPGVDNSNSWGVEIIARNDADVTPAQAEAAVRLQQYLSSNYGLPPDRVFGHGELTGRKESTEGKAVTSLLREITGVKKPWVPFRERTNG